MLSFGLLSALRPPVAEAAGVAINSTNFPDANFRTAVKTLDTNSNNYLGYTELCAAKKLSCGGKSISSLQGIAFSETWSGKYYFIAVLWAYYNDPRITNGTSATTFSPNKTCSRAAIVSYLYRYYTGYDLA